MSDIIVMSGGVMNNDGLIMPAIQAHRVKLVMAKSGNHAGLIGAADSFIQTETK